MSAALLLVQALAFLFPGQAGAAPLSLADVVRMAEEHSTQVRAARNDVAIAQARVGQQASRGNPQLGFAAEAVEYDKRSTLSLGGSTVEVTPTHQEALGIALSQLLDVTGQVGTAVSQAKLLTLSAKYDLEATRENVDLEATTTYYDLLRADRNVSVAQAALDAYREQLKISTKLWQGGVGQRIDTYRADSQVADAERELVRRENERDAVRSALNDLIGRSLDDATALAEAAPAPAEDPADRKALIDRALDERPEALAAKVEIEAAKKGIKLAKASNEPTVTISLGGNYYPTPSLTYVRPSVGALTLAASFPIFDGGLARERTREARSTLDTAKAQEDRTRRDIALQVQNASLDVDTARRSLRAADVALEAAVAARDLAKQRYESQVGLYLEVSDAQAALTAAQAAQVDATYALLTAEARLARALGQPVTK